MIAVLVPALAFLGHGGERPSTTSSTALARQVIAPPATIDLPAVDRVIPPEVAGDVKKVFGAKGDGRTDDTAAIQKAISGGLGFGNPKKIIYFPAGTYLVSRSLEWRLPDGSWSTWLALVGQNRDRTRIRLIDGAPGFGDARNPRAVIVTGSQNAMANDGSGNQAFNNYISDLTVDAGRNPGANGIDFLASNRGAIRNVIVTAPAGSGNVGVTMTRRWPGPCLLQDVSVRGFARGIVVAGWQYSVTAADIRLQNQRVVGLENLNNVVSMAGLISRNRVPAVRNGKPDGRDSLLTLVDARLLGGVLGAAAIENNGNALLRGVAGQGYSAVVRHRGVNTYVSNGNWASANPVFAAKATGSSKRAIAGAITKLAPAQPAAVPAIPLARWATVSSYGALPDDNRDDTEGIQRALRAGKPVVSFKPGWYQVTRPLTVPSSVRLIEGFEGSIDATRGAFAGGSTKAVFVVKGDPATPLTVSQLVFKASPAVVDLGRLGSRTLDLRSLHIGGLPFRGGRGLIFLSDVEGGNGWRIDAGQQVWARQLNAEQQGLKVVNDGGKLWILGLKTERPGTAVRTLDGGKTEVLGGLLYPATAVKDDSPAFVAVDSLQSLTFATSAHRPDHDYRMLVTETRESSTSTLSPASAPRRAGIGNVLTLYATRP